MRDRSNRPAPPRTTEPSALASSRSAELSSHPFDSLLPALREAITESCQGLPYQKLHALLADGGTRFRAEVIARALEPSFNARVREMAKGTCDEKRVLCKWINSTLGDLGLAVKLPDSREPVPCWLRAGSGGAPAIGRFEFNYETPDGKPGILRRQHLPESLTLVAAAPRHKPGRGTITDLLEHGKDDKAESRPKKRKSGG